jgi:predicted DCC family thiol-disulfide oxidoreductase YuxK
LWLASRMKNRIEVQDGESQMSDLTVLYDGACSLCLGSVARVRRFDAAGRIEFLDVRDAAVRARFPQVDPEVALRWMQAVDANGRAWSGADAWARMGMLLPGWRWVAWILTAPGIHWIAAQVYAWVARNRYRWNREVCADGTCTLHRPRVEKP